MRHSNTNPACTYLLPWLVVAVAMGCSSAESDPEQGLEAPADETTAASNAPLVAALESMSVSDDAGLLAQLTQRDGYVARFYAAEDGTALAAELFRPEQRVEASDLDGDGDIGFADLYATVAGDLLDPAVYDRLAVADELALEAAEIDEPVTDVDVGSVGGSDLVSPEGSPIALERGVGSDEGVLQAPEGPGLGEMGVSFPACAHDANVYEAGGEFFANTFCVSKDGFKLKTCQVNVNTDITRGWFKLKRLRAEGQDMSQCNNAKLILRSFYRTGTNKHRITDNLPLPLGAIGSLKRTLPNHWNNYDHRMQVTLEKVDGLEARHINLVTQR